MELRDLMSGVLRGVGVGPGDPELVTRKAWRLIAAARVLAYPAPEGGESFARAVVAEAIAPGTAEIPIEIPMRAERFPAQAVYDAAAARIGAHLAAGEDVIVLCEGDPFFYGSFMYLFARLAGAHPVEITPGVAAMTACAAAAARPLCARNECLTVVPATLPEDVLEARLGAAEAAAVMKVGRHLPKLRRVVARLGREDRAVYVGRASLPDEIVAPLADAPASAPYFSMVLIGGSDPYVGA
jgi:precorrin-2/cobalt-factor-2 C20-methyltransferase